jgi:hypothetical protein
MSPCPLQAACISTKLLHLVKQFVAITTLITSLAASLTRPTAACTEVVAAGRYGYAYPSEIMSSRTLDFPFLGDTLTVSCHFFRCWAM